MGMVINFLIKLSFAVFLLGSVTVGCFLPVAPVLMLCEKKQAAVEINSKAYFNWAAVFCTVTFAVLACSLMLSVYFLHTSIVQNFLNGILSWSQSLT